MTHPLVSYHASMSKHDGPPLADLPLADILSKRKALKRQLAAREDLQPVRIAVLGGSTTEEVVDLLELWLLDSGFQPSFYQSTFGQFFSEAVHDSEAVEAFQPDVVYFHTSIFNIQNFPAISAGEGEFDQAIRAELDRFRQIWTSLEQKLGCIVIQNNFELPPEAIFGNLDAVLPAGRTRFILELNRRFAQAAAATPQLFLQDVAGISARMGLDRWFDPRRWFSYKLPTSAEGSNALATSLAATVTALFGRTRKVLVLDLDNTLWGGVIGDDGVDRIQIGPETPLAEAYTAFQRYCLRLRDRGILLAVCSKNDAALAGEGFDHPDSVLRLEHFACFRANWQSKPENLLSIAAELSLGLDSFVFVDDNPAERALVRAQFPEVAVPEIGSDPAFYPSRIEAGRFFEQVCFSAEDASRSALYRADTRRAAAAANCFSYASYLDSLDMTAEIEPFNTLYLGRITQLTNKTNQFNLTSRRYTLAEMQSIHADPNALHLYGRLSDRFGDNGLISVLLGHRNGDILDIDLWLMSCRVLKRDMECAMLDEVVARARARGICTLRGTYVPTRKNDAVADHYARMGFHLLSSQADGSTVYTLDLAGYQPRNRHIRVHGSLPTPLPMLALAGA